MWAMWSMILLTSVVVYVSAGNGGDGQHAVVLTSEPVERNVLFEPLAVEYYTNFQSNRIWIRFDYLNLSWLYDVQCVVGYERQGRQGKSAKSQKNANQSCGLTFVDQIWHIECYHTQRTCSLIHYTTMRCSHLFLSFTNICDALFCGCSG